jgi:hypothetical protein
MGPPSPRPLPRAERDPIVSWRTSRLRQAGFDDRLARDLAASRAYDLHAVLELVDRGCPPVLAARILAPI